MAKDKSTPESADATETAKAPVAAKLNPNIIDAGKAAQAEAKKPRYDFIVSYDGESHEVNAQDFREAWAQVCDKRKSWPSIKYSGVRISDAEGKQVYPSR